MVMFECVDVYVCVMMMMGGVDVSGGGFSKKIFGLKVCVMWWDGIWGMVNVLKICVDVLIDGVGDVGV